MDLRQQYLAHAAVPAMRLTIHSSRSRFAARLDSGVRRQWKCPFHSTGRGSRGAKAPSLVGCGPTLHSALSLFRVGAVRPDPLLRLLVTVHCRTTAPESSYS